MAWAETLCAALAAADKIQLASASFDYSGWLTEANHLGNVTFRVGKKLIWHPKKLKASNAPEADRFIYRTYRQSWKL